MQDDKKEVVCMQAVASMVNFTFITSTHAYIQAQMLMLSHLLNSFLGTKFVCLCKYAERLIKFVSIKPLLLVV